MSPAPMAVEKVLRKRMGLALELWMERQLKGVKPCLVPYDDAAVEALRKLQISNLVLVEIRRPRNITFHRKFFAMLQIVFSASGDWTSLEDLLDDLKFHMGHVDRKQIIDKKTGETFEYVKPKSISFSSMDETVFELFYERAMRELCVMAGGIEYSDLRNEVLSQLATA